MRKIFFIAMVCLLALSCRRTDHTVDVPWVEPPGADFFVIFSNDTISDTLIYSEFDPFATNCSIEIRRDSALFPSLNYWNEEQFCDIYKLLPADSIAWLDSVHAGDTIDTVPDYAYRLTLRFNTFYSGITEPVDAPLIDTMFTEGPVPVYPRFLQRDAKVQQTYFQLFLYEPKTERQLITVIPDYNDASNTRSLIVQNQMEIRQLESGLGLPGSSRFVLRGSYWLSLENGKFSQAVFRVPIGTL